MGCHISGVAMGSEDTLVKELLIWCLFKYLYKFSLEGLYLT